MARRRSRRRKNSYSQDERSGYPPELIIEDLSPRARRLVEGGVIDISVVAGSGEQGRITSGDVLHAARVMEVEQSVARIETVGREVMSAPIVDPEPSVAPPLEEPDLDPEPPKSIAQEETLYEPEAMTNVSSEILDETSETPNRPSVEANLVADEEQETDQLRALIPDVTDAEATSATDVTGEPVSTPPNPWDAYNGISEGLAESARPGAEQSWGEAEAHIAAIAEEAAYQLYGRASSPAESPSPPIIEVPEEAAPPEEPVEDIGLVGPPPSATPAEPTAVVSALRDAEAAVDPEREISEQLAEPDPVSIVRESIGEKVSAESEDAVEIVAVSPTDERVEDTVVSTDDPVVESAAEPSAAVPDELGVEEAMIGFGTLVTVNPESVWAEGVDYFAPWFLAHSRQLGDALGLEAGLSDARQFTTKSTTGVLGRDDNGDDVVVVSTENAVAEDSDLGRALGMVASSGASTVALVSARFDEEQLQALEWLNNQSKSGVSWYAIELKVVRIADSPAAMLFNLVAAPPSPQTDDD